MNLRAMPTGDLIFVLEQMTLSARDAWSNHPMLQVFLPHADAIREGLKTAQARSTRDTASEPDQSRPADRRAEHAIRALFYGLKMVQSLASARDEADRARALAEASDDLFASGLAFLGAAVPVQIGETSRLVTLASSEPIASLFQDQRFGDLTWPELLALIAERNEALRDVTAPLVKSPPADSGPQAPTLNQVRNAAVSFLNDILPIIDRAYPASDPANAEPRRRLLGDLSTRALVASRKAKAAAAASTPAPAPAEPEPVA